MTNRLGGDAVAKHLAKSPMKPSVNEIVGAVGANLLGCRIKILGFQIRHDVGGPLPKRHFLIKQPR